MTKGKHCQQERNNKTEKSVIDPIWQEMCYGPWNAERERRLGCFIHKKAKAQAFQPRVMLVIEIPYHYNRISATLLLGRLLMVWT